MSTKKELAKSIKVGFLFGVLDTIVSAVVFRHTINCSITTGVATFASTAAFFITRDFLTPEEEYIDERTEEDN